METNGYAVVFNDLVIGYITDGEPVAAVVEKHLGAKSSPVAALPVSCKDYPIGSLLEHGAEWHRVVEKNIASWISGAQLKVRSEPIGVVRTIKLADPSVISAIAGARRELSAAADRERECNLEIEKLRSVVTCITNVMKESEIEADKLRVELAETMRYNAVMSDKCERVLKALANSTSPKNALEVFNGPA